MERPSTQQRTSEYDQLPQIPNLVRRVDLVHKHYEVLPTQSKVIKTQRFIHPQVIKMFNRAQYLIHIGDNAVAAKLLTRCLELNPFDSHSWLAYARLEAKLGNIDHARQLFTQAVTKCPRNVHLLHAWGHMEQKYGNEAIARDCWSQAMEVSPLRHCDHRVTLPWFCSWNLSIPMFAMR